MTNNTTIEDHGNKRISNILKFKSNNDYCAKLFIVKTVYGDFKIAGTLCGNIDVALPHSSTLALTIEEVDLLVSALVGSREDVRSSASPSDSRIIKEQYNE